MRKRTKIAAALLTVSMLALGLPVYKTGFAMSMGAEEAAEPVNHYIDTGEHFDSYIPPERNALLREAALPSQYSSVEQGYVTPVKNQFSHGTCWAFSAVGAGETYRLRNGLDVNPDYSEYQLAYFFYHHENDVLGNLKNDETSILSSRFNYLTLGGNNTWTAFLLANWTGLANEANAPYDMASPSSVLPASLAYDDALHMQNAYFIPMSDSDMVKRMIIERGSVVSGMFCSPGNSFAYFNPELTASYQNVSRSANHSVLIVGYDDDYSKDNFKSTCCPENDGAWLVKNSWGEASAPFVWISYEDLCMSNQTAYAYEFESADNYDYNYQYDGAFGTSYLVLRDGYSIANVYTASGALIEDICAVSFALQSANVGYSIQIYRNSPTDKPTKGEPMLDNPITGQTTYAGYYTIPLETPVQVACGDTFAVVVTLNSLDGSGDVSAYVDADLVVSDLVQFDSYTQAHQSYYMFGDTVCDLKEKFDKDYCFRVKAFTKAAYDGQTIDLSKVSVADINDKEYTGSAIKPSPKLQYGLLTLVKNRDYKLSYSNNKERGTATVTITGKGFFTGTKKVKFNIVGKVNPTTVYNGVDYSAVYDYNYYTKKYSDVWKTYGQDDAKVIRHFVTKGMTEGRRGIKTFDVMSYAYQYYDLRKNYKNNLKKYYQHYMAYGKNEGRIATGVTQMQGGPTKYGGVNYKDVFKVGYYVNKYSDVKKAYGLDDAAILKHFVRNGMKEGRRGSSAFNPKTYKKRYPALEKKYGNNYKKYYLHYINTGKAKGWSGK